jgi:hypothetical protein
MQPRVFLLERAPRVNTSPAKKWGHITTIFPEDCVRASFWDDVFKVQLFARLDELEFDPQEDLFLVAGQMAPLAIAIGAMVCKFGSVNLLLYHAVEQDYRWKTIGDTPHAER